MFFIKMTKTAQKHINIKATSLRYLYEIAAIPAETREQFLQKLLKRKNAAEQKNVKLLKIIFTHIKEDKMLEWDEKEICENLEISKEMLYCHKCYLLKGLRLLYFKWYEIEKNEFNDKTKYKDEVSLKFAKAEKMMKIGMEKEAKNLFKQIENELINNHKKTKEDSELLLNVYAFLCKYYYFKKLKPFNYYYSKLEKLGKKMIKRYSNLEPVVISNFYLTMAFKINFYSQKSKDLCKCIDYLKIAYSEMKKTGYYEEQALLLYFLALFSQLTQRHDEYKKYINAGLRLSARLNSDIANVIHYSFKIRNHSENLNNPKISKQELFKDIKNAIEVVDNTKSFKWNQLLLFILIVVISHFEEKKGLLNIILYKYNSRKIISDGLDSSMRSLFTMKFVYYLDNLPKTFLNTEDKTKKEYITVKEINPLIMKKMDNLIMELSINSKKMVQMAFKQEFLTLMILTDFWKGKECSLEFSTHIIKQIKWMLKISATHDPNADLIEIAHFGIIAMTDFKILAKNDFLLKHENKFKYYIDVILKTHKGLILSTYYMLAFIAEQCGYEELKDMCKKTFWKIQKKYPEKTKGAINEIKEKQNLENKLNPASISQAA